MINLLQETIKALQDVGKSPVAVDWVQWEQFFCSWPEFEAIASFEYNNGFGGAEIKTSLKIVGTGWWLERGEYDGSEWWEFKAPPTRPNIARQPIEKDLRDD